MKTSRLKPPQNKDHLLASITRSAFSMLLSCLRNTVEPVLKDHPIGHKKCGLSRQVVFGNRSITLKFGWSLKTGGLSWQWPLKTGEAGSTVRPNHKKDQSIIQENLSWKTTPLAISNMNSLVTGAFALKNVEPSAREMRSFKTGGPWQQWSPKTGFTVFLCVVFILRFHCTFANNYEGFYKLDFTSRNNDC